VIPKQIADAGPADATPMARGPSTGLEYFQVRAATRRWQSPSPHAVGPRPRFGGFATPEDRKTIREFLLQPLRLDDKPANTEAPPAISEVVVPVQVR
jgi:hypothetical protein